MLYTGSTSNVLFRLSQSYRDLAIVNGSILSQYGPIYDRKTPGL